MPQERGQVVRQAMISFDDAIFGPIWLRSALTAAALGWGLLELAIGDIGWAAIFLGAGL
jgi:hypothetical protein